MRYSKKLLSFILSLAFVFALAFANPVNANAAEYTYRIKIYLGNNADASFNEVAVAELCEKYEIELTSTQLEIKGLKYGQNIDIDVDSLISISPNAQTGTAKYYLAGLRVSGGDAIITQAKLDSEKHMDVRASFSIKGDESYVAAYGVGEAIPYEVRYVDEDGNALLPADTYFAALGEKVLVPAKHVDGYYPDAYYRTASKGLQQGTVFTFNYKKSTKETIVVTDTEYETETIYEQPVYEYQYSRLDNRTGDNDQTGTASNRRSRGNGTGRDADAEQSDSDAADGSAQSDENQNTDSAEISDDETPTDIIDIDEEEVAKFASGEEAVHRNIMLAIILAIIAILVIIITFILIAKNKKKVPVLIQKSDAEETDEKLKNE